MLCSQNILCRIFGINAVISNQCRLFQGDMNIHGNVIPSSLNNVRVGGIQFSTDLYLNYPQPCSSDFDRNRYLICGSNFTWTFPPNTYWNQAISICAAQSPVLGSVCQQNISMCREDLNYTCLQFNQCARTFMFLLFSTVLILFILALLLLIGTTIGDSSTVIANSSTVGLVYPYGILVNKTGILR
jgi:hypothetical protein